jgi:GNAT superfamily N-acetyltransferase
LNAALYAASRILGIVSAGRVRLLHYYITAQPVRDDALTPPRRGRSITVTEADLGEVLTIPVDRPRAVLQSRLQRGGRCLVARKNGVFAGFQWFTMNDYLEDEVRCLYRVEPEDRCAWDYDIYVMPEWRTQPVFTRLWDTCNEILRKHGVRYTLSRIHGHNTSSRHAHESIGATNIGWAVFLCAGNAQLALFSAKPWLQLTQRRTPVLLVSKMAVRALPSSLETAA